MWHVRGVYCELELGAKVLEVRNTGYGGEICRCAELGKGGRNMYRNGRNGRNGRNMRA